MGSIREGRAQKISIQRADPFPQKKRLEKRKMIVPVEILLGNSSV